MKKLLSSFLFLTIIQVCFGQNELVTIQRYLQEHAAQWNLKTTDFTNLEIVSATSSKSPGTKHWKVRQTKNAVSIVDGFGIVTLRNNEVIHVTTNFVSISEPANQATLSAAEAVSFSLKHLNIPTADLKQLQKKESTFLFSKDGLSREDIPVKLVLGEYKGQLVYLWDLSIYPLQSQHWWSMRINAETGEVLFQNDWMTHCTVEHCSAESHQVAQSQSMMAPPPPGADQYMVYALPNISPAHGNRVLVTNPSDGTYSPFGWHDTDGLAGDEYTITYGNNVYAGEDIDNDDILGYSPDGGTGLDFNFPYDSLVGVQGNLDAVITNLFYMNNMMHDIWAHYGFDEESGNFQETNYSGSGLGQDQVYAQAQDGSGTNNANFGTPPDGMNPSMQMYLWTESNVPDLLSINAPASLSGAYSCSTAGFGPAVPTTPITEDIILVLDDGTDITDGCGVITNGAALVGKIALVRRGNCTFGEKVEACEAMGAVAVIVMNNTGTSTQAMGGTSVTNIPSIMVSKPNGDAFVNQINQGNTVNGTIVNPGDLTATDSDFDNMIIAHEYGHGISNRLVGGADNSDCLWNGEQMGEGWSDWFGLMITQVASDLGTDGRGVGTYVTNEPNNGGGIRPARYSTDFAINDYTYGNTNSNSLSQPHGIGFVWATMLWDLNWALIEEYGFDPNMKTGTGGNNIAMHLVIEGLKLTNCGPGFVDGRDGIIAADQILYGGANRCLIWRVFAKRGLGFSADQGDPDNRNDQVEAFNIPPSCTLGLDENKAAASVQVFPNPSTGKMTVKNTHSEINEVQLIDLSGKVVYTKSVSGNELVIDISSLNKGLYLMKVQTQNGSETIRVEKF
jgi:extracellular elastinolytic metalloproteinase